MHEAKKNNAYIIVVVAIEIMIIIITNNNNTVLQSVFNKVLNMENKHFLFRNITVCTENSSVEDSYYESHVYKVTYCVGSGAGCH